MQFVAALSRFARDRTQIKSPGSTHQYRREALVVRRQQQTVALMTVAEPLRFAIVTRQNKTDMPRKRGEHSFVFSEHGPTHRVHKVTSLMLWPRTQLFFRDAQFR